MLRIREKVQESLSVSEREKYITLKTWSVPKIHQLNIASDTKSGKHSNYEHGNHHHPSNPPS